MTDKTELLRIAEAISTGERYRLIHWVDHEAVMLAKWAKSQLSRQPAATGVREGLQMLIERKMSPAISSEISDSIIEPTALSCADAILAAFPILQQDSGVAIPELTHEGMRRVVEE